jgi:hypothetical protein
MTRLRRLRLDYFRESLATVAAMHQLEYLRLLGPAKSWAALRECTQLEEAHLVEVQIANLRRWNTWSRLRSLTLGGRGIKSLAGLEANQALQDLTLLNLDMSTLSSLRELPHLASLSLRMAETVDLESIASVPRLRTLVIDTARHDNQPIRLPSLRPLERTASLEEITLFDVVIEDRDLTPLAGLNNLKRVRLGSSIGADVGKLRAARPDLEIQYTPPDTRFDKLREQVGVVTIQRPGEGLQDWSIFQDLSTRLGTSTNYAAGSRLKSEIRQRDSQLARRLDWDTEAGAVACYAKTEADIRAVAALINELAK